MYCRTCGNKMNDNAELCVKCGVRRNVGDDFCQVCGARTVAGMTACKKCGAKLMKAMSSVQIKKKAVSKGRKTIGTILLVLAIILLIAGVGQMIAGFASSGYGSIQRVGYGGRCLVIGAFMFSVSKIVNKKK